MTYVASLPANNLDEKEIKDQEIKSFDFYLSQIDTNKLTKNETKALIAVAKAFNLFNIDCIEKSS